jgi:RimJ/RimL family protein N-acetyltransferase
MPGAPFTSLGDAMAHIEVSMRSFLDHGLGTLAIRLARRLTPDLDKGRFVGAGGLRFLDEGGVWNLGYRLDRDAWGLGLATEVCHAAFAAAAQVAPRHPVTARVFASNSASVAVLEKIGLNLIWEGSRAADVRSATDTLPLRRIYADRDLDVPTLSWLQSRV